MKFGKIKKKKEDDDWDFDFSMYDQPEDDFEMVETLEKERPRFTGLRSRFSMGQMELEIINERKAEVSRLSVEIEARKQDISLCWKYYGLLSELWEKFRNIYGQGMNDEVMAIKTRCHELLRYYKSGKIEDKLYNNLLYFRMQIYRLMQLSNLSFEVERISRSGFSQAQRKIEQ